MPEFYTTIYPESQLLPAQGWHWLAHRMLKSSDGSIPKGLCDPRLIACLLSAQENESKPLQTGERIIDKSFWIAAQLQKIEPFEPYAVHNLQTLATKLFSDSTSGTTEHLLNGLILIDLLDRQSDKPGAIRLLQSLVQTYGRYRWLTLGAKRLKENESIPLASLYHETLHQP
jgi:hypothetical protein